MAKDFDIDKFVRVTLGLAQAHKKWNAQEHPRNPDGTFARKFKLLVHEPRRNYITELPENFLTVPDKVSWGMTLEPGWDEYQRAQDDWMEADMSYMRKDPFSEKMMREMDEQNAKEYPDWKAPVDRWAHLSAEDTKKFSNKRKQEARNLYADLMHKYIRNIDLSNMPPKFEEHFHKIVDASRKNLQMPVLLEDALQEAYRRSSGNTTEKIREQERRNRKWKSS